MARQILQTWLLIAVAALFCSTGLIRDAEAEIVSKKELLAAAQKGVRQLGPEALHQQMEQGADLLVLDVRTERERDAGYIGGSVWIPRGVLEFKIYEVCKNPDRPIVVYCRKGGRSLLAVKTLERMGYSNVSNLLGGINAWGAKGLSAV